MSSSVKKIGSKYLVHVDILKAFRAELEKLPPKEKILFDFKSAVDFLRPFLELAVEKNYTKDEIFELMGKVGWRITRNKFKQFWSFYLLEDENSGKKKGHSKKSIKSETSNENFQKGKSDLSYDFSADEINDENEIKDSNVDVQNSNIETNLSQENTDEKHETKKFSSVKNWLSGNPYFSVTPDTEDL